MCGLYCLFLFNSPMGLVPQIIVVYSYEYYIYCIVKSLKNALQTKFKIKIKEISSQITVFLIQIYICNLHIVEESSITHLMIMDFPTSFRIVLMTMEHIGPFVLIPFNTENYF